MERNKGEGCFGGSGVKLSYLMEYGEAKNRVTARRIRIFYNPKKPNNDNDDEGKKEKFFI